MSTGTPPTPQPAPAPPGRRLNLDDLQPDGIILTFGGVEYELPGEIPLPTIIRLLRFVEKVDAAKGADGSDSRLIADAMEGVVEDVMELIRMGQPDTPTLPFTMSGLLKVVNFLVEGQKVAATVAGSEDDDEDAADPLAQAS